MSVPETQANVGPEQIPTTAPDHSRFTLEELVCEFTTRLRTEYPNRIALRPKPFKKRVLRLVNAGLPPYRRPGGRPKMDRVTRATGMFREARLLNAYVDWQQIAMTCIKGFSAMSEWRRRRELDRLRNSVYVRIKRAKNPCRTPVFGSNTHFPDET
jgi:hypothetical protein